jgi:hypothetical protein
MVTDGDPVLQADGIGGSVKYVFKNIEITIDNYTLNAPFAWVQDTNCNDFIIGREVIFDVFDIEFKQADETIVFKKKEVNSQ